MRDIHIIISDTYDLKYVVPCISLSISKYIPIGEFSEFNEFND